MSLPAFGKNSLKRGLRRWFSVFLSALLRCNIMHGSIAIPFSELFADTVNAHGAEWARKHYTKGGMSAWEFSFWLNAYEVAA